MDSKPSYFWNPEYSLETIKHQLEKVFVARTGSDGKMKETFILVVETRNDKIDPNKPKKLTSMSWLHT